MTNEQIFLLFVEFAAFLTVLVIILRALLVERMRDEEQRR